MEKVKLGYGVIATARVLRERWSLDYGDGMMTVQWWRMDDNGFWERTGGTEGVDDWKEGLDKLRALAGAAVEEGFEDPEPDA